MFEIANHGWNHENFTPFDKEEQAYLGGKTNKKLNGIFGVNLRVFIAPYKGVNKDMFLAAQRKASNTLARAQHSTERHMMSKLNSICIICDK